MQTVVTVTDGERVQGLSLDLDPNNPNGDLINLINITVAAVRYVGLREGLGSGHRSQEGLALQRAVHRYIDLAKDSPNE